MSEVEALVEASLYVDDLGAAEAFYRDVLGLAVIGKEEGRHVFFRVGGGVLLVFDPRATRKGETLPPHGAEGPGHVALGIRAESLADLARAARSPRGRRREGGRMASGGDVDLLPRPVGQFGRAPDAGALGTGIRLVGGIPPASDPSR